MPSTSTITRTNPEVVEPLPADFLGLPLPDQREFARDGYDHYRSGSLGEALQLAGTIAKGFGAKAKFLGKIDWARNSLETYLPYAPVTSAVLKDAHDGTSTVRPEHIAPLLQTQESALPWRFKRLLGKLGLRLGGELSTTMFLGGLDRALTDSPEAKQAFDRQVKPRLEQAEPYIRNYSGFERGPRGELRVEVRGLLGIIVQNASEVATRNQAQQGNQLDPFELARNPAPYVDRATVGEAIRLTAIGVLQGDYDLPMVNNIVADVLKLMGKDRASALEQVKTTKAVTFTVAAHRVIKALNAMLPETGQYKILEKLASGGSGAAVAAGAYPGKAGRIYRALDRLPHVLRTLIQHVPTENRHLTRPVEVLTALTDPDRPTIARSRRVGSLALTA